MSWILLFVLIGSAGQEPLVNQVIENGRPVTFLSESACSAAAAKIPAAPPSMTQSGKRVFCQEIFAAPGSSTFIAPAGKSARAVVMAWAAQSGAHVLWEATQDWTLPDRLEYSGSFDEAYGQLAAAHGHPWSTLNMPDGLIVRDAGSR